MKPMLAAKAPDDLSVLGDITRFAVSPKLDGIRACVVDGVVQSRTGKPIPNRELSALLSRPEYTGLDGELIYGSPTAPDVFQRTTSAVMTHDAPADGVVFHVFDDFSVPSRPYVDRYDAMVLGRRRCFDRDCMTWVNHFEPSTLGHVVHIEQTLVARGYEGAILRDKHAPYKFGRSTVREGGMLKVKRFSDAEALVISAMELVRQDGSMGGILGALMVKDVQTGVMFSVGTGFTQEQRVALWVDRAGLLGRTITYKYFAGGVKDAPRFPVFHRFREVE